MSVVQFFLISRNPIIRDQCFSFWFSHVCKLRGTFKPNSSNLVYGVLRFGSQYSFIGGRGAGGFLVYFFQNNFSHFHNFTVLVGMRHISILRKDYWHLKPQDFFVDYFYFNDIFSSAYSSAFWQWADNVHSLVKYTLHLSKISIFFLLFIYFCPFLPIDTSRQLLRNCTIHIKPIPLKHSSTQCKNWVKWL